MNNKLACRLYDYHADVYCNVVMLYFVAGVLKSACL